MMSRFKLAIATYICNGSIVINEYGTSFVLQLNIKNTVIRLFIFPQKMASIAECTGGNDCMILYDNAKRWNDAEKTICKIRRFMEGVPLTITLPQRQILPGEDIITRLATKADIAILLIAVPSKLFLDLIDQMKSRDLRLIPLFCDMSREEAERIIVYEDIPILGITEICVNQGEY